LQWHEHIEDEGGKRFRVVAVVGDHNCFYRSRKNTTSPNLSSVGAQWVNWIGMQKLGKSNERVVWIPGKQSGDMVGSWELWFETSLMLGDRLQGVVWKIGTGVTSDREGEVPFLLVGFGIQNRGQRQLLGLRAEESQLQALDSAGWKQMEDGKVSLNPWPIIYLIFALCQTVRMPWKECNPPQVRLVTNTPVEFAGGTEFDGGCDRVVQSQCEELAIERYDRG
jgi:hypothetical protein